MPSAFVPSPAPRIDVRRRRLGGRLALALVLGMTSGCGPKMGDVPNIAEVDPAVRRVPSPEEFRLGPGDRISIDVWRHNDLDLEVTIAPDGTITYPLVGAVTVTGMTYPDLVEVLTVAISEYYDNPQVAVNIVELQSQKVIVLGEVTNPAVLQLNNEMSILEALTLSGGINQSSRTDNVLLIRGGLEAPELYSVNVKAIYTEGALDQVVYLQQGDVVVVPTRTITNVSRYFREVQSILAPFVAGSAVYRNAVSGGAQGTSSVLVD